MKVKQTRSIHSVHFKDEDFYEMKQGLRMLKSGALPNKMQVCRICLAMDIKMYAFTKFKLNQMFEEITGIISEDERFPQYVCWECSARLTAAVKLRHKAFQADALLHQLIEKTNHLKIHDIKLIDRNNYGLKSSLNFCETRKSYDSTYKILTTEVKGENSVNVIFSEDENEEPQETEYLDVSEENNIDYIKQDMSQNNDEVETDEYMTEYLDISEDITPSDVDENIHARINNDEPKENDNVSNKKSRKRVKLKDLEKTGEDISNNEELEVNAEPENEKIYVNNSSRYYRHNVKFKELITSVFEDEDDEWLDNIEKIIDVAKKRCEKNSLVAKETQKAKKHCDQNKIMSKETKKIGNCLHGTGNKLDAPFESTFIITRLTIDEQIQEVLKRKESDSYLTAQYKCDICYKGFECKNKYDVHISLHDEKNGSFECLICKRRFDTRQRYRHHLYINHTELFQCTLCEYSTNIRVTAKRHHEWHGGSFRFTCENCGEVFHQITNYSDHLKSTHGIESVCQLCGLSFLTEIGLRSHKSRKHKMEAPISMDGPYCALCDVKFANTEAFETHVLKTSRHRSDPLRELLLEKRRDKRLENSGGHKYVKKPQVPVTCEQCGEKLQSFKSYCAHFKSTHPNMTRAIKPNLKPRKLEQFMCENCGKIFRNKVLLRTHMWVHTGVKMYNCEICAKNFSQKSSLILHMKTHQVRETYECSICGKRCLSQENRKKHMLVHSDARPYKCNYCEKAFKIAYLVRTHVLHTHLKKPWPKRIRNRQQKTCKDISDVIVDEINTI